jgi:hypothetical protein
VACRLDEVDTSMNSIVDDVHTIDLVLGLEICIESLLNVFDDGPPGIIVVDEITESWSVHDGQSKSHTILLNICTDGLDRDCLWDDVETRTLALAWRIEGGVEKSVDEG